MVPLAIIGVGITVIVVAAEVVVQPFPSVYVTLIVPGVETVIVELVCVVDHTLFVAYEEVKSTEDPAQMVVGPEAEITGAVAGTKMVTVVNSVDWHPAPFVTTQEYCVVAAGETDMDGVVPRGIEPSNH